MPRYSLSHHHSHAGGSSPIKSMVAGWLAEQPAIQQSGTLCILHWAESWNVVYSPPESKVRVAVLVGYFFT